MLAVLGKPVPRKPVDSMVAAQPVLVTPMKALVVALATSV
jgi:hypothetical protein